jgi:hypothetical protein
MEIDLTPVAIKGYSAKQIRQWLGISERRLRDYCQLLRESCPTEFSHPKGSGFYSTENYIALKKVRTLFRLGATHEQVKQTLRLEGF